MFIIMRLKQRMEITTTGMYKKDKSTWNRWKRKTGLNDAELHERIVNSAVDKLLYDEFVKRDLTTRDDFKRPLSGRKIDKSKISIENRCTDYR